MLRTEQIFFKYQGSICNTTSRVIKELDTLTAWCDCNQDLFPNFFLFKTSITASPSPSQLALNHFCSQFI